MNLLYKCPKAENQYNLSILNTKPKLVQDKEQREIERMMESRREEYEKALQGDKPRPKDLNWVKYDHVYKKLNPKETKPKDYYRPKNVKKEEETPFLTKEQFGDNTPLLIMSRQMRENDVFGKPSMNLYFKPTKARDDDIDVEFGRITKKYKTIY
jgi:hypothetical protein